MKRLLTFALFLAVCSCRKKDNIPPVGTIRFVNNSQDVYGCYVDDSLSCTLQPSETHDFIVASGEHGFEIDQKSGYPLIAEDGYLEVKSSDPYVIPVK